MLKLEWKWTPFSTHTGPGDKRGWLYFSIKCQRRPLVSSGSLVEGPLLPVTGTLSSGFMDAQPRSPGETLLPHLPSLPRVHEVFLP